MQNTCEYVKDLMIDYVNQKLSDTEKVGLFSHLASCEACRKDLSLLYALKKQTVSLNIQIPDAMSEAILKNILEKSGSISAACENQKGIGCKMADRIFHSIYQPPCDLVKGIVSTILYPVDASLQAINNY